jgi:hypothetical protein
MYWLLGRKSKLSTSNKLLTYKEILKPIWAYGIQLSGTASSSNIEIQDRFQSKALRMIVKAPLYVPNTVIRKDLQTQLKRTAAETALSSPQRTPIRPSSEPHGAARQKQTIAKTRAK